MDFLQMKDKCGICKYYVKLISDYAKSFGNFGCCQLPTDIKRLAQVTADPYEVVEENEVCEFFKN